MKSELLGKSIFDAEVTNLDRHGLWLLVRGEEFFLPFTDFPWFTQAKVQEALNVELLHENHLRWPDLDIDLTVESLRDPTQFPLLWQRRR